MSDNIDIDFPSHYANLPFDTSNDDWVATFDALAQGTTKDLEAVDDTNFEIFDNNRDPSSEQLPVNQAPDSQYDTPALSTNLTFSSTEDTASTLHSPSARSNDAENGSHATAVGAHASVMTSMPTDAELQSYSSTVPHTSLPEGIPSVGTPRQQLGEMRAIILQRRQRRAEQRLTPQHRSTQSSYVSPYPDQASKPGYGKPKAVTQPVRDYQLEASLKDFYGRFGYASHNSIVVKDLSGQLYEGVAGNLWVHYPHIRKLVETKLQHDNATLEARRAAKNGMMQVSQAYLPQPQQSYARLDSTSSGLVAGGQQAYLSPPQHSLAQVDSTSGGLVPGGQQAYFLQRQQSYARLDPTSSDFVAGGQQVSVQQAQAELGSPCAADDNNEDRHPDDEDLELANNHHARTQPDSRGGVDGLQRSVLEVNGIHGLNLSVMETAAHTVQSSPERIPAASGDAKQRTASSQPEVQPSHSSTNEGPALGAPGSGASLSYQAKHSSFEEAREAIAANNAYQNLELPMEKVNDFKDMSVVHKYAAKLLGVLLAPHDPAPEDFDEVQKQWHQKTQTDAMRQVERMTTTPEQKDLVNNLCLLAFEPLAPLYEIGVLIPTYQSILQEKRLKIDRTSDIHTRAQKMIDAAEKNVHIRVDILKDEKKKLELFALGPDDYLKKKLINTKTNCTKAGRIMEAKLKKEALKVAGRGGQAADVHEGDASAPPTPMTTPAPAGKKRVREEEEDDAEGRVQKHRRIVKKTD